MISLKTIAAICLGATLCSAQTINIRGVVRDDADNGISGATVMLENAEISVTTGADGSFALTGNVMAIPPNITARAMVSNRILVQNGRITFSLSETSPVGIGIHDISGRQIYTNKKMYSPGTHAINSPLQSPGIYLYRVSIGKETYTFRSSPFGTVSTQRSTVAGGTATLAKQSKSLAVIADVISVVKEGQLNYRDSIRTSDTNGIVIKMIPNAGNVTDADGNVYQSVQIGNQVWTVENWRCTKYDDGTEIPHVADSAAWAALTGPGYCYRNNTTHADAIKKWGAFYNWYVISPTNSKQIAPDGWRLPTNSDWTVLENYLIAKGYSVAGEMAGNNIAKSMAAKTDWCKSTDAGTIGKELWKNNASGFSALPGGVRSEDGNFDTLKIGAVWWGAAEDGASIACLRFLFYSSSSLHGNNTGTERSGFSVRLVRDLEFPLQQTSLVVYNGNGNTGGIAPGPKIKTHGVALTISGNTGNLVKLGYAFVGWNTAADGTGEDYAVGESYSVDSNVTLYAKYQIPPIISAQIGTFEGSLVPLSVVVNKNATVYYVVLNAGSYPPTVLDVRDGVDATGVSVAAGFKGTMNVTANVAGTVNLAINDGRDYMIYVIAIDSEGNRSGTPTTVLAMASVLAPPAFSETTPALSSSTGSIAVIIVNISKVGTVYAVGVEAGESAPTAAQIKAGQNRSGSSAVASGSAAVRVANANVSLELCGFAANRAYTIYAAAEREEGAIGVAPRTVSIETGPKPAANVAVIGDSGVTVTFNGDDVALTNDKATPEVEIGANCVGLEVSRPYNQYGGALIGAVTWNCGSDSAKTDRTWKYSFIAPTGWNTVGFDESRWHNARELSEVPATVRQAMYEVVEDEPKYSLDQNAKWVWSGPDYYYRKEIVTPAGTAIIKVCGAQTYSLFVDGVVLVDRDSSYLVAKELTVDLSAGAHCFAAVATDTTKGDWGGNFIMELVINGQSYITDDSWNVFVEEVDGWKVVGFDDSGWYGANNLGNYVLSQNPSDPKDVPRLTGDWFRHWLKSPVFGPKRVDGVVVPASTARWIGGPYTIFFRKEFTLE